MRSFVVMSNSLRPIGLQPAKLFCPWNFSAKDTGVQSTPVFLPGESCGQRSLVGCCPQGHTELDTTEVTQHTHMHACHFLLQEIFPTQESNLSLQRLLHYRWILYLLSHWGSSSGPIQLMFLVEGIRTHTYRGKTMRGQWKEKWLSTSQAERPQRKPAC